MGPRNGDDATADLVKRPAGPVWFRVGFATALLWALVGIALAFLLAQIGRPTLSGWAALLTGPVTLLTVGRRTKLHGRGNWTRATVLAIGLIWIVGSAAIFFWAMAAYG
jgi:hypothetical protein